MSRLYAKTHAQDSFCLHLDRTDNNISWGWRTEVIYKQSSSKWVFIVLCFRLRTSEKVHVQSIIYPRWQVRVSILHFSLGGDKLNSLRPRQNGRLFADDTFKRIFLNENIRISTKISLQFVPKGLINNIPVIGSEAMLVRSVTHICVTRPQWVSLLSSKDSIRWHRYESSLAQVIAFLHITYTSVVLRLLASIPMQFHWK